MKIVKSCTPSAQPLLKEFREHTKNLPIGTIFRVTWDGYSGMSDIYMLVMHDTKRGYLDLSTGSGYTDSDTGTRKCILQILYKARLVTGEDE